MKSEGEVRARLERHCPICNRKLVSYPECGNDLVCPRHGWVLNGSGKGFETKRMKIIVRDESIVDVIDKKTETIVGTIILLGGGGGG